MPQSVIASRTSRSRRFQIEVTDFLVAPIAALGGGAGAGVAAAGPAPTGGDIRSKIIGADSRFGETRQTIMARAVWKGVNDASTGNWTIQTVPVFAWRHCHKPATRGVAELVAHVTPDTNRSSGGGVVGHERTADWEKQMKGAVYSIARISATEAAPMRSGT